MSVVPPELLALAPLSLAAGVDLFLTLLFIGFIGSPPVAGLWETPLPGALGNLEAPGVLVMVGAFYIAELAAERFPATALAWNAFNAVIRPVSGILLALLLLDGQPLAVVVVGSLVGGFLASIAHGARTGWWVLRHLRDAEGPSPLLVSVAEDAVVVGIVSLTLDAPLWAFAVSMVVLLAISPFVPSLLRAFAYAIRLGIARLFRTIGPSGWRRAEELPEWIAPALADQSRSRTLGGALRGCRVGAWRLEGAPRFAIGWMVVRAGRPAFLFGRGRRPSRIDLEERRAVSIRDRDLFRRVDLEGGGASACLFVGSSGPSTENLRAELMAP